MAAGLSASSAVRDVISETEYKDYRQLLAIDATGQTGIHSGGNVLGKWGEAQGRDVAAGGNLLKPHRYLLQLWLVLKTLRDTWATGCCRDAPGLKAGGEEGPVHSAGFLLWTKYLGQLLNCDVTGQKTVPLQKSQLLGKFTNLSWMIMCDAP